ncbi:aldose 1-epimerase family protein [Methylocystis heyeri]|uniref:Aldose 1-epimerase family protein n=1 Tax=Methylocystis heyeri TaxID=391905 RepID=A0A6B8KCN2_9HYPH|nr:aldose 1-epimerase family protein [Methylocystis heyeri]QGM44851.1 aldose 1-epimerase family protein [Methylocystis heyeri]
MSKTILLRNPAGDTAEIDSFGAELMSWRASGAELVWREDPAVWDQSAPILFPVVGWTRNGAVRVAGKTYPLSLHGFAWRKQFSIRGGAEDFVRLALEADDETRALYPFEFELLAEFRLLPGGLENALVVTNKGETPLPYACGLHPAFNWPLAGSNAPHSVVFEQAEGSEVPIIAPGGLISSRTKPVPVSGNALSLSLDLMKNDALVFLDLKSRSLAFDNGAGARLRVELQDFPHIGFWSLPPAPYLCIEPWTGYGDPEDFYGELAEKPSMRLLAPGESARHAAIFRFESTVSID